MKQVLHRRPSASMVVSIIALIVALSGTAIAATQMSGDQLIKKQSLSGNRLKNHTITGTQVNLKKLGKVPSAANADHASKATSATNATHATNATNATNAATAASANTVKNVTLVPLTRVAATDGVDFATAEAAAPQKTLFTRGPFTIYAKCFRDSTANKLYPEVFISTTAPGSMYDSDDAPADGTSGTVPVLNPADPEQSRIIVDGDGPASANGFAHEDPDYTMFWAAAPNGTTLQGAFDAFGANGTVVPSMFGTGNACLFFGRVFG